MGGTVVVVERKEEEGQATAVEWNKYFLPTQSKASSGNVMCLSLPCARLPALDLLPISMRTFTSV